MSDIDVSDLERTYGEVDGDPDNFGTVPDGKYQVVVDSVDLKEGKAGRIFEWTFRVTDGPHENSRIRKPVFFDRGKDQAKTLSMFKKDMVRCGMERNLTMGETVDQRERLLDIPLEINVVTNGQYQNVYIRKRLTNATPTSTPGPQEDSIPF